MNVTIFLLLFFLIIMSILLSLAYRKYVSTNSQPPSPKPVPPQPSPPEPPSPTPPKPQPEPPSPTPPSPPQPEPEPSPPAPPSPPEPVPPTPPSPPKPEPPVPEIHTFKAMFYSRESNKYLSYQPGLENAPNAVESIEYGLWDVHFLGDYKDSSTPMIIQVPSLAEAFGNTYMSIIPFQNHSPSLQNEPSSWIGMNSTNWTSDGTNLLKDFLLQSSETGEYLGSKGWNPSAQKEKNGAILWTLILLNMDVKVSPQNSVKLFGYLQFPFDDQFNYVIYDNAKEGKYVPRLGYYDLQNLWTFDLRPKDPSLKNEWIMEMQVPEKARSDHFPKWFMSSTGKGPGNDSHASKNRHAPSMDSSSNPNTKWTLHIIQLESQTEIASTYLVHIESNNNYFLTPTKEGTSWRPSLTSNHDPPEKILFKLVLLNGITI